MLRPNFPAGAVGVFAPIPLVLCGFVSAEDLNSGYFPSLGPVDGLSSKDMGIAQKHWGKVRECEVLELTEMGLTLEMSIPRAVSSAGPEIYQVVGLADMENCPSCTFC